MKREQQTLTYSGQCFEKIDIRMEYLPNTENPTSVKVHIDTSGKKSLFCKEHLFVSTMMVHHLEDLFLPRKHELTFLNLHKDDFNDIKTDGFVVYMFCHGVADTFISFFNTMKLFVGGLSTDPRWPIIGSHVPAYMEKANVKFLKNYLGWDMKERKTQKVWMTEDQIHSGDFVAIFRLDGLDQIIMWGTGGRLGHSAAVLEIDGEKYVVESQDGWYWPKQGIQRTKWKDWVKYAENADFHVSILPLSEKKREQFNLTAAVDWFKKMEGYPYGYHNFLFGWVDTPEDNFPNQMPYLLLPIVFEIFDKISHPVVNSFILEALNHRLESSGLGYHEIIKEASARGMTLDQVIAMPEKDYWVYSDGPSYVCSCLVVGLWKAAGLFEGANIHATEFTPKDIYNLNFFNTNPDLPEQCKLADPDLPYCQILGKYKMELPNYSIIEPYTHMNERCPSKEPDYVRPDGC